MAGYAVIPIRTDCGYAVPAIAGRLDLEGVSASVNLELRECFLPDGLAACDACLSVLRLDGCRVEHSRGSAVAADRLSASLVALNGATVAGQGAGGAVSLSGARITRIECDGADFSNDCGPALFAEAVQVEQDVLLSDGFEADGLGQDGAVCLIGARIGGQLDLTGARLLNHDEHPGHVALNAARLAVAGDILGNNLTCCGEMRLDDAEVAGSVHLEGAHLSHSAEWPLTCQRLKAHELVLLTAEPIEGADLRHAHIDLLRDDPKTWPQKLKLDGLTYGVLEPSGTSEQRRGWLARDADYRPQPYEQLASQYRQLGNDRPYPDENHGSRHAPMPMAQELP